MADGPTGSDLELEVLLADEQTFPPPPEFTAQANANDPAIYQQADEDFEGWWESWAKRLEWAGPWGTRSWIGTRRAKWFVDGKLKMS